MSIQSILLSIFIGLLPEAIFFALFIMGAKRYTEKKILFVFSCIAVFILSMLLAYNIWAYVLITVLLYFVMKIIYKGTEFIDLFLLTMPCLIIGILGYICYMIKCFIPMYPNLITHILNKILLFLTLSALYPRLNTWYNTYRKLWNRHEDNKIKSITVRNISILVCNIIIMAAFIMLAIRM